MASNSKNIPGERQSNLPESLQQMDLETIRLAVTILAGAVLEASDELVRQMKSKQREPVVPDIFHGPKIPGETSRDLMRFALTGFLLDSSVRASRWISTAEYVSNEAAGFLFSAFRPFTHSRLMRPARRRFYRFVDTGEKLVEGWIDAGRIRENESRLIARQAATIIIDDFIDYLSTNKEIRELVQEQGVSMTGEAVAEIRERSANADEFAEQIFNIILRRRNRMIEQSNRSGSSDTDSSDREDIG
ncbi:MAG: hypothetical protein P8074_24965 [Anaerolineales bacterium]|jgi:hypothetical protein